MIIETGREYWRKVNHLQKSLMIHMGMEKVIEVRPDGHVLFEAKGMRYIIEPSGEVMSGGTRYEPDRPGPIPQTMPAREDDLLKYYKVPPSAF